MTVKDSMSFSRPRYDDCTYERTVKNNINILDHIMDPVRNERPAKCRHELGLVGGPAVSHISGNLVDLESELLGITRIQNKCITNKVAPLPEGGTIVNDKTKPIDTRKRHLAACQMISYRSVPLPQAMELPRCK